MQKIKLSPRLAEAAELVQSGTVADIGADHAHLAIYLIQKGNTRVLASDINEGPCQRARMNIYAWGLHGKIRVVCRPGLQGIEDFSPDNIVIAGMGGELIRDILSGSTYPKVSKCRLVLLPHSMQRELRQYLCSEGFSIDEERVVFDGGKYYQVLAAHYTGEAYTLSDAEERLGRINLIKARSGGEPYAGWLGTVKRSACRRISGRTATADDTIEQKNDRELVRIIDEITV